ncbi:hypothetical protein, partial [Burkholderia glumae]|uniref:hypothetical protein n=1 Tax=Burkholderia glumae TaxID=337 RepID=UPI001E334847
RGRAKPESRLAPGGTRGTGTADDREKQAAGFGGRPPAADLDGAVPHAVQEGTMRWQLEHLDLP